MLLLLQRSAEQETALRQLLDAQQTKGSGSYHAWLTPGQFGQQFGPSDADVQAVTDWLTKQGLQVAKVSAGRTTVEFNGTVAQVQNAFHTQIHHFVVNGNEHIANVSDPAIPAALAPVVRGVVALNNFPKHSMMHRVGSFQRDLATGQVKPLFTYDLQHSGRRGWQWTKHRRCGAIEYQHSGRAGLPNDVWTGGE
jgi:subtilase family serine protease